MHRKRFYLVLCWIVASTGGAVASHSNWPEKPNLEPLVRIPAYIPESCKAGMSDKEVVAVEFDVGPDGIPVNPSVSSSSNTCLNPATLAAVRRWKFMEESSPASHVRYEFSFLKFESNENPKSFRPTIISH